MIRENYPEIANENTTTIFVVYVANSKMANIYDFRGILISVDTTGDSNVRALLAHARAQSAHVCSERTGTRPTDQRVPTRDPQGPFPFGDVTNSFYTVMRCHRG